MVDPALQIEKQGADQSPNSADKEFEAKYTNDSVYAVVHTVSRGTRRSRQGIHTRRRQLRRRFGLVYRWRTAALSEYQAGTQDSAALDHTMGFRQVTRQIGLGFCGFSQQRRFLQHGRASLYGP
jgi:hypothetical protein